MFINCKGKKSRLNDQKQAMVLGILNLLCNENRGQIDSKNEKKKTKAKIKLREHEGTCANSIKP